MSFLGYSIIGDDLYGKTISKKRYKNNSLKEKLKLVESFERQALHATKLSFEHPITKKYLNFSSDLPQRYEKSNRNFKGIEFKSSY